MAYVITERCVKCGACESECPNGAILEEEKKFAINYVKCVECGNCIDNCFSFITTNVIITKNFVCRNCC